VSHLVIGAANEKADAAFEKILMLPENVNRVLSILFWKLQSFPKPRVQMSPAHFKKERGNGQADRTGIERRRGAGWLQLFPLMREKGIFTSFEVFMAYTR
jgi:hypothetical protein